MGRATLTDMGAMTDLARSTGVAGTSPALTAYTARPPGRERRPGIVVLHEGFGLDDVTRRHADRLASLGYLVIAPDLFTGGGTLRCLRASILAMRRGEGQPFQDIAAARQWLLDRDDCTGRVGVIGFCMGGAFALLCATGRGFDVSSANYGMLPQTPEMLRGACPVVASYGGRDKLLTGAAGKLDRALTRLGVEHDVKEYPAAGHQFMNDAENAPWFLRPVLRLSTAGPEPDSAADSWARIDGFFSRHLRG